MQFFSLRSLGWASLAALVFAFVLVFPGSALQGDDPQANEQGAQIYAENCAVCHGPNGEGRIGATLAKDWPSIRPDLRVEETIRTGIPGSPMPAWSQANGGPLTDAEIDALVTFILSWQTGGPPIIVATPTSEPRPPLTPPPGVSGDPNQGAVLFDQNCVVCHGENGQGRVGATLAKDWPSIRPDLQIKATIERGVPGSPMPAWSQANGGPLTEAQINHIVSYILTWETPAGAVEAVETPAAPPAVSSSPVVWGAVIVIFLLLIAVIVYFSGRSRQQA
jgi:mono/diheme cytochrome c family protein